LRQGAIALIHSAPTGEKLPHRDGHISAFDSVLLQVEDPVDAERRFDSIAMPFSKPSSGGSACASISSGSPGWSIARWKIMIGLLGIYPTA
jgi:hypothetical protein